MQARMSSIMLRIQHLLPLLVASVVPRGNVAAAAARLEQCAPAMVDVSTTAFEHLHSTIRAMEVRV